MSHDTCTSSTTVAIGENHDCEKVYSVAVVGAGAGGIAMACNLKMKGIDDFVVLEKSPQVGGCWFDTLFKPDWSKKYSKQPEIQKYLQDTASKFGVDKMIRFNSEVTGASWDDSLSIWTLHIRRPDLISYSVPASPDISSPITILKSKFLLVAPGPLSIPKYPNIPGLSSFRGSMVHSARWDPKLELTGKRVGIVGNGASAVQIVGEISGKVAEEHGLFWVVEDNVKKDTGIVEVGEEFYMDLGKLELTWLVMKINSPIHRIATWLFLKDLEKRVKDPILRKKLTPKHPVGCKRITPSDLYYDALQKPHVSLITERIVKFEENGILDATGQEHALDVIILATGFDVGNPIKGRFVGRNKVDLAALWQSEGLEAHRGTFIHHFPNLAMLSGPNSGLGHNSQIQQMESQISLIIPVIQKIHSGAIITIEPKLEKQRLWNAKLQKRFEGKVWTSAGCQSWYRDERGKVVALWPGLATEFLWETLWPLWSEYDIKSRV
ncbi:hypothetical protein HDU67_008533 [Dinochytrium kinnereticum]|nr:hypothetical protein HDU67_008533 [Dinochytrium kinnereticum]